MLTRLYIDNFRSFVNFEYKPGQKQLLLGANGCGKSSLLDAILYVKQFIRGDGNPFAQSTRTRWLEQPIQAFEVEARLDGSIYEYRLEIRFASETRQLSVNMESLKVDGAPVFALTGGEIQFFTNGSSKPSVLKWETTESALHLSQFSNPFVRRFVSWMEKSIHCFRIDNYPGKMDESADSEVEQPDYELEYFVGWYRHLLQSQPVANANYIKSLQETMEGFRTLRFSSEEDGVKRLRLDFESPTPKPVTLSLSELSDGQRCLLNLYAILHFKIAEGQTIFIDEPDNFIALREIQPWLLAASQAAEDHGGQLVIVSHHPELLDQWASAYGLLFFREENGQVRLEKFKGDPEGNLAPSELIARGWELE